MWVPTGNVKEGEVLASLSLINCNTERKDLTLNIPNFENITIELKTHNDSILLSALYRPPNTNETEFIINYKRLLNKFNQDEISRLVLGLDHNLDFIKHDKHRPTKEFIELNLDHQLLPSFTKPTRNYQKQLYSH